MIKDTNLLRRSILSLLKNNSPLSHNEITLAFPSFSAGAVKTALSILKDQGAIQKINNVCSFLSDDTQPTTGAVLYNALSKGRFYTYDQLHGVSPLSTLSLTDSAIQTLVNDQALSRVKRGLYSILPLPTILPPHKTKLAMPNSYVPVCPIKREIWKSLSSEDESPINDLKKEILGKFDLKTKSLSHALYELITEGQLISDGVHVCKAQDLYPPSDADKVWAYGDRNNTFTYAEVKKIISSPYPQNVIKTLLRLNAIEPVERGVYKALPLPPPLTPPNTHTIQACGAPQKQYTAPVTHRHERILKALQESLKAKEALASLLSQHELSIKEISEIRGRAKALNEKADQMEATFAQPLAQAQERDSKAKDNLRKAFSDLELI